MKLLIRYKELRLNHENDKADTWIECGKLKILH